LSFIKKTHQVSPPWLQGVEDGSRDEDEEGAEDEAQEGQVKKPDVEGRDAVGDPGVKGKCL